MRLYNEFSEWWPLFSPPEDYAEEGDYFLPLLQGGTEDGPAVSVLELGSGGGSLAYHLRRHFKMTLSDISDGMLAISRKVNPDCEHIRGDMRTLSLGREFDRVLIHDAVMYLTEPGEVQAALRTAAIHCRRGGLVVVAPDFVQESFTPDSECGGEDGPDGRALRYLEWSWDQDPSDTWCDGIYALVLRSPDGQVRMELDRHRFGSFPRAHWLQWLDEAGLPAHSYDDPWNRVIFVARKR